MKYDFDEVIDRRHDPSSYSIKWAKDPKIGKMLGADTINDDTIAIFTADMDFRCAPPIIDALRGVVDHGIFGYSAAPEPDYSDAVIDWFKRRENWEIKPEELIYVNGTVEAMKQIILALTEPGDGVIIQRPVYGPFSSTIEGTGRTIVNNQLISDDEGYYTMDFEDLEQKCKDPDNKLLMLCSPHNPVGRIWTDAELAELARICRENDVIIAADEIHGDLIRRGLEFHPIATLADNVNIITATAANKTFNLAGLHCTNLVIKNPELREKMKKSLGLTMDLAETLALPMSVVWAAIRNWIDQGLV